jgi:hypothetical protein
MSGFALALASLAPRKLRGARAGHVSTGAVAIPAGPEDPAAAPFQRKSRISSGSQVNIFDTQLWIKMRKRSIVMHQYDFSSARPLRYASRTVMAVRICQLDFGTEG